ncbi:conserved oligomeric Golgi complex subunit 8, partial [Phenoliferia sp. Uapishka_3]
MAAAGIKLVSTQATSNGTVPAPSPDDGIVGVEENDERTRWAKRWIELWREVIGETIGMYTEVFLATPSTSHSVDEPTEDSLSATAPLSLFLSSSLSSLTTTLLQTLPALTSTSSLSSILTQLSYCSHSFARFGLEFREIEQIRERVEQRVGVIIAGDLETAGYRWEKEWRDGWEGGIRRRGKERKAMAQWLVVAEGLATALATPLPPPPEQTASDAWHHQPSPSLSLLPPLARFLNAHATALNSLRLLPAISLFPVLRKAQGRALDRATQVLSAFVDAWASSVEAHIPPSGELSNEEIAAEAVRADEKKLIIFAIAAFGRWVVPWCEGALRVGVYAELKGMEDSVGTALAQEAMRKAEALIAKVQGREASVEVGGLPTPTDIEQPGLNQVPSAPPPSLEPELDLPPSLDPSVDAPPPSATEISFEPSLEPTLERTQELVEDSAPKSLVPEAVEEAVVSPPEPEPELPADKSAEGYAVEEDELPAKEIELTKDNVLNGKGHESTSEDLSIPPIEPPPEIATLVDTAPSENGPTGKLKTNGDAKEGPRVVSEGVVEAGEINGAVTLE